MTELKQLNLNAQTGETEIVPLSAEQIAEQEAFVQGELAKAQENNLRSERNRRLAETDYLGLPDLGGFTTEMVAYRQALRDLPANTTDPANPVWPEKPNT